MNISGIELRPGGAPVPGTDHTPKSNQFIRHAARIAAPVVGTAIAIFTTACRPNEPMSAEGSQQLISASNTGDPNRCVVVTEGGGWYDVAPNYAYLPRGKKFTIRRDPDGPQGPQGVIPLKTPVTAGEIQDGTAAGLWANDEVCP